MNYHRSRKQRSASKKGAERAERAANRATNHAPKSTDKKDPWPITALYSASKAGGICQHEEDAWKDPVLCGATQTLQVRKKSPSGWMQYVTAQEWSQSHQDIWCHSRVLSGMRQVSHLHPCDERIISHLEHDADVPQFRAQKARHDRS